MGKHQPLSVRQPFSTVWQAANLLNCAERRVYHHIQAARLPLAFDISRPARDRICVRVATASVVALQYKRRPPADLEPFLAGALPETQFSYKVSELARLFQCDMDHIYHLIGAKLLEDIGGSVHYRVPRESVAQFLTKRRVK